jgi:competence protein ComEC
MMNFTASYTFRLGLPLCFGIALADALALQAGGLRIAGCPLTLLLLYGSAALALVLFALLFLFLRKEQSVFREKFGFTLALLMLSLGSCLYMLQYRSVRVDWPREERAYRASLYDHPLVKKKHLRCPVQVEGHRVLLYLPDDSLGRTLQRGDELLFYGRITHSDSAQYDRIYFHQGVSGTAFVRSGQWRMTGRRHPLTLRQKALACRDRIVDVYRRWGLTGDELAVLSALTVGQTDELSTELRGHFSAAGMSHILALSGLHVGLIWSVLTLLFPAYLPRGIRRWARWLFVSLMLTAYVFLAGLPPSAVRAVVMCIVWEANYCLSTEYTPRLHSLLSVSFLMLLVQPFYLFQLSFQLSVMAVGTILAFYEPLVESVRHRLGYHAAKVSFLIVPMLAQLGVAPITLYYFHTFPVYFLLSSVVAVWVAEAIVYFALALLLFTGWGWMEVMGGKVMHGLLWLLLQMAQGVSRLPHALGRVGGFTLLEVAGMYLLILLIYRWMMQPTLRRALWLFIGFDAELALWLFL